nr:cell division control protein 6 homolog B-like isoform X1 [Tanacetum cinerariifolium]
QAYGCVFSSLLHGSDHNDSQSTVDGKHHHSAYIYMNLLYVRVDHMAIALLRAYKSPIVDTIQSLPQHQQIVLCSAVKLFRRGKKDTTIGELNKYYIDLRKSTSIPPIGIMELSCMSRVLGDQVKAMELIDKLEVTRRGPYSGIVADSDPGDEQRECENKSVALARAIDLAKSSFIDK